MGTQELVKEITLLPNAERWLLIEQIMKMIRYGESRFQMENAVNELQEEYKTNKELTAFSDIDFDTFYEAR